MRIIGYIAIILLTLSNSAFAQSASSAEDFLRDLYARYGESGPDPATLGARAPLVFDGTMLSLLRRDQRSGEISFLSSDPLCDCQDHDISDVRIRVRLRDPSSAEADVTFVKLGHETGVGLDLVWTQSGWRISDVHDQSIPSVLAMLTKMLPPEPVSAKKAKGNR